MQRYSETREASRELLHLILPLRSRQTTDFHPISYALWYESPAALRDAQTMSAQTRH